MPNQTDLEALGLLKISGLDAKKFLQGQLTCNLEELSELGLFGAHCNPQGRILFFFRIFYFKDAYYLVLPAIMVQTAVQCLKKYAVFFKIELLDMNARAQETERSLASKQWKFFNIYEGIPHIYPQTSGKFLPHDLNLHLTNALSWNKGCYTGQEIIARMHYKAKLKNKLHPARIQTHLTPQRGLEIYTSNAEFAGTIVDALQEKEDQYHLLVLTHPDMLTNPCTLNPAQKEQWEWLN